jgi:hypothetical protein
VAFVGVLAKKGWADDRGGRSGGKSVTSAVRKSRLTLNNLKKGVKPVSNSTVAANSAVAVNTHSIIVSAAIEISIHKVSLLGLLSTHET